MDSISLKARAKINLTLDVLSKRPDGYHELRMVMQTLRLHDSLLIAKTRKYPLKLICDDEALPTDGRNLVYKAALFLKREFCISSGVLIRLQKRIPIAAGLAGGSSDCAAVLKGMNRLFTLNIPSARLMEIGRSFGADVPFCLMEGTALAEGVGEKLTRLASHPPVWVALACPRVAVSTRDVFDAYPSKLLEYTSDIRLISDALAQKDLPGIAARFINALTAVTVGMHPEVGSLIVRFKELGALNAAMSGSGPCVFAYFTERIAAVAALRAIQQEYPRANRVYLTRVYNKRIII